ncbi:LPS export ABC transporter periplasmic protein LptC [Rhodocyclus tenuis]|uniref:LPS export ABC transporter periplasmic protein LptC n=2 Tax=Rhodocyclus TaxID=1064 RepID=A0A6L5JZ59_RHOTE|nr:LPS export ABC transporter periplasmic protein LptC [Rhodocyclus gracilis]MQY52635.1 LPS export ABC transporter periplasmic protein LptC [Rhodocyclus gracilis]MRD73332.1 LPS export ABC transporter periplasmic protein LptC [Rhodocyclus gracilis]NJA88931.1 LPS export ABC transporter periplasmic protein LptC [Rhodocyclus gracilis]
MKRLSSALFPLTVLLALAALSWWLRGAVELPEEKHDGKTRHDPDYIVSQSELRKFDNNGRLQYTLTSDEIRHFPDDDTTDLKKPLLVHVAPGRPTTRMSSDRAHLSQDGERVDLYDNVRVERAASGKRDTMVATMPQLTVLPDDEKAFTASPVRITEGASWLTGVGMRIDSVTENYVLESRAVGQFESPNAKKH